MGKIIVALDVDSAAKAQELVDHLGDEVDFYKVDLQLLTLAGPNFIKRLVLAKKRVFLDLKLFEIPSSVKGAILAAGDLGVSMVTVHASGGRSIMEAAVNAARSFLNLEILALTVVTSLTDQDLRDVGIQATREEQTLRLAQLAKESGCHGLIASPAELISLRKFTSEMTIVTPGIRADKYSVDGQTSDSPKAAIQNGASYIIMGRSIVSAMDPRTAIREALTFL